MREKTYAFVNEHLTHILTALLERAVGVAIIDKKDDTGEKIYDLPPDPTAAKILLEHAMGKAPESLDVTSGDKPIAILAHVLSNKRNAKGSGDATANQGSAGGSDAGLDDLVPEPKQ